MCPNGNSDLTRNLILQSAIKIISLDGLDALTAGRLIEEAKISKGGLYHHFKTMTDVVSEVLERLSQGIALRISSYSIPSSKQDFLDQLEDQLFDCFITSSESSKALFGFISASANNKNLQVTLRRLMDEISFHRLKQLKAVSPGTSHATLHNTVQIISTLEQGLMNRFFISGDSASLRCYWRGCRRILEGLLDVEAKMETAGDISEIKVTSLAKCQ